MSPEGRIRRAEYAEGGKQPSWNSEGGGGEESSMGRIMGCGNFQISYFGFVWHEVGHDNSRDRHQTKSRRRRILALNPGGKNGKQFPFR